MRVRTPQQALDVVRKDPHRFDLISIDLYFLEPSGDQEKGLELTRQLKDMAPDIPLIVVTKDNTWKMAKEAIDVGAKFVRGEIQHAFTYKESNKDFKIIAIKYRPFQKKNLPFELKEWLWKDFDWVNQQIDALSSSNSSSDLLLDSTITAGFYQKLDGEILEIADTIFKRR